jgi:hypothetical protein
MLSEQQQKAIAEELVGTAKSAADLQDDYPDSETFEIEAAAQAYGIVRCATCGWWCDESDLDMNSNCEDHRFD